MQENFILGGFGGGFLRRLEDEIEPEALRNAKKSIGMSRIGWIAWISGWISGFGAWQRVPVEI